MKWKSATRVLLFLAAGLFSSVLYAETVWIDVRSASEHRIDHIEGDIHIPHVRIVEGVTARFSDKGTEIHLYCASGARAQKALTALQRHGYEDVSNEGGIDDARRARGLRD